MNWISTKERLPELSLGISENGSPIATGCDVLICLAEINHITIVMLMFTGEDGLSFLDQHSKLINLNEVSHWARLPKNPLQDGN